MKKYKFLFCLVFAVIALFPFYWMFATSLSPNIFIEDIGIFPFPPQWGNYLYLLLNFPFARWFLNSAIVSLSTVFITLFIGSLAAFAFSCLRFRFRDIIFYSLIITLIIPGFMKVIPHFFIINKLGGIDTHWGLVLPLCFEVWTILLLRQGFLLMPQSLLDASRIDGANLWTIYWRIVLPASKSILFAVFLIRFIWIWNALYWPLIILQSESKYTVTVGLSSFRSTFQVEYNYIMTASILGLLPVLILFLIYQRRIEHGLRMRLT